MLQIRPVLMSIWWLVVQGLKHYIVIQKCINNLIAELQQTAVLDDDTTYGYFFFTYMYMYLVITVNYGVFDKV